MVERSAFELAAQLIRPGVIGTGEGSRSARRLHDQPRTPMRTDVLKNPDLFIDAAHHEQRTPRHLYRLDITGIRDIGRDPGEITISEQMAVVIGRDAGDLAAQMEVAKMFIGGFVDLDTMAVIGTPDQVVAKLEAKMELGVTDFAIVFGDLGSEATLELFATQVMERFRA